MHNNMKLKAITVKNSVKLTLLYKLWFDGKNADFSIEIIIVIAFYAHFFREISSLVTSLAKTLFSRNFWQKWVNFRNFHSVNWFHEKNVDFYNTEFIKRFGIFYKKIETFAWCHNETPKPHRIKHTVHFVRASSACIPPKRPKW